MDGRINRRMALGLAGGLGGAALLAGCGGGDEPSAPPAAQIPAPTEGGGVQAASCGTGSWEPTFPSGFQKYDPPVQVTATWQPTAGLQFKSGESFTNNPMYNRLKDTLGIEYVPKFQANTSVWQEKLSQTIASGDLPDVFPLTGTDLAGIIDNDGAAEIREIWDATASPLVKEKREYPGGSPWSVSTRGEELYGIPFSNGPAYNTDNIGYIRTDLLDTIGADLPKSIEEMIDALRELKGRGLVEYGIASCKAINTYSVSLDPVFGAFGSMPKVWRDNGQGRLEYGSISAQTKQALEALTGWYKEGLMDPDFYTKTVQDAMPLAYSGKQAVVFSPWFGVNGMVTHEQSDKDVEWAIFGNPSGPGGGPARKGSSPVDGAVVFRTGLERQKIEAVITQLNWSTEIHANWTKYHQYGEHTNSTAWTDGYEYVLDGCDIARGEVPTQFIYLNFVGFNFPAVSYPAYQSDVFQDILAWQDLPKSELDLTQSMLLEDKALLRTVESYDHVFQTRDEGVVDEFLGVPTETMLKRSADLEQLELETFTKIIVGQEGPEAFDEFVTQWKANGGDQITEEVNTWKQQQG